MQSSLALIHHVRRLRELTFVFLYSLCSHTSVTNSTMNSLMLKLLIVLKTVAFFI